MANSKGPSTMRSMMYNGKQSLLPPKSPFPTIAPSYADSLSNSAIPPKGTHHRTSSESFLIEEQPSWLDDLLNEPDSPVRRAHRRSSSDSFTYMESANANRFTSWDFKNTNRPWTSRDKFLLQASIVDGNTSSDKKEAFESADASDRNDYSNNKAYASETDTKRAKQQFAQRSRVRKLQYIAELEKNVQALQAEGSEVSAEVDFLNQQSLILGMENKALKQRLDNLAQEQLIKYMEHEVLEREIGRLRALYQQQQQPQQTPPSHRRSASKDKLDTQFSNLSLKKESGSTRDVSGPLHI